MLDDQYCIVCGKPILVSIFKNTKVCCENFRKIRDGEIPS